VSVNEWSSALRITIQTGRPSCASSIRHRASVLPAENPFYGGVFTPAHELTFNSDPKELWVKLRSKGDVEDTAASQRCIRTGKDRSETVGENAEWQVNKDVNWSVKGSVANHVGQKYSVNSDSIDFHASHVSCSRWGPVTSSLTLMELRSMAVRYCI